MNGSRRQGKRAPTRRALVVGVVGLTICLGCVPFSAWAGESIVWNGAGAPGTTGTMRPDPSGLGVQALFPDAPSGNSVSVNADVPGLVSGGLAVSGSGSATAKDNSAVVNGGLVHDGVIGGSAYSAYGSATATDNSAIVNGGSVGGGVYGGSASSSFGSATATDNSVIVNGVLVDGRVVGGYAYSASGSATATDNSAVVNGGSVGFGVYGGYADSNSGSATATGNSVTLSGSPVFGANSDIYGGEAKVGGIPSGDAFSNNTLNVWNYTGSTVGDVRNFQYYHFVLPAAMRGGDTLFRAGTVTLGNGAGTDSTVSGVSIMGGGDPLRAGDSVTLITGNFSGTIGNNNALVAGQKGVSMLYDFRLSQSANALKATVARVQAHPQAKALSEGRVAGLALVNQGADLIAGTGMDAARQSASGGAGFSPFFAFQGGTARYDTGSHADLDGFSLLAGLAWNREAAGGGLLLGVFFESGWGDYDSRNAFNGLVSVQGQGDTQYYGGGVLGRMEFPLGRAGRAAAARPRVLYVEASARAGWADTDFSSRDLRDGMGRNATYASGAAYYGAHLGLGYVWNITVRSSLDVYTRYFWTRQDGDAVSVTDDPIRFESSDSHRWRAGARFSHALTTAGGLVVTPYLGAAWEHEFDGRAQATAYGHALDAPDLTGGTGIGELGVSFRPSAQSGLAFDLALRGHAGVRRGVSGGFQAKWSF